MNIRGPGRGYTLLEIVVTSTIAACLCAIALPSYHRSILKEQRMTARSALMDLAARQEDYRLEHRAYAHDIGVLVGPPGTAEVARRYLGRDGTWQNEPQKDSIYRVDILDVTSPSTAACGPASPDDPIQPRGLVASAIGPQSSDHACRKLILCFAGRPGAKAAFDEAGHSTPAIRDTCWGLRSG